MLDNVKEVLQSAGWYKNRKIDISYLELYLIKSGYKVYPKVKQFLEEFGMLEIVIKTPDRINKEDRNHTNPEKTISNYYTYGSFSQEEKYANENLVPVGQIRNENLILLVSESGKVYCNTGKLGENFDDAWEAIINRNGFKAWGSY